MWGCLLLLTALLSLWSTGLQTTDAAVGFLPLLAREKGLARLIQCAEALFAHSFRPGCVVLSNASVNGERSSLCLTEEMLQLPHHLLSFREFTEQAVQYTPRVTRRTQKLGYTFPYLSGGIFRAIADNRQETYTNHQWGKTTVGRALSQASPITNRSLVYWSLNRYKEDIQKLRKWLQSGEIRHHFFLISHNQDRPAYPAWLLDHPLVLKVFGPHVPYQQHHPKLVPIPLGLPKPTKPPKALHTARQQQGPDVAPTQLLLSRFRVDLGPQRPLVAKAIARNFPNLTTAQIKKQGFFEELARTKFIVSPPGVGLESGKAAEALYFGRVPIVSHLFRNDSLQGLPFVTAWNWTAVTPAWLQQKWSDFLKEPAKKYDVEKLWAPWWIVFVLRQCLQVP
eukprot:EG_transcript_14843